MKNLGCGKKLKVGDLAFNRWGVIICEECDKKHLAPMFAVYEGGYLKRECRCGDYVDKIRELRR